MFKKILWKELENKYGVEYELTNYSAYLPGCRILDQIRIVRKEKHLTFNGEEYEDATSFVVPLDLIKEFLDGRT